jgi:hypothetical protein
MLPQDHASKVLELDRGVFMVSVDLELAWGFNYELLVGSKTAYKYLRIIKERSRRNVKKLLELSEEYQIPFTWGIVGHLFLPSCSRGGNGLPHPDMPRPALDVNRDWYSNDPCSNMSDDPLWYGADIVKQILESSVEQDIACHSFSHVDFSRCSREVALAEVRKCKEVMKDFGIEAKCFIFPKNRVGHLDVLEQEGFRVFRFKQQHILKHPIEVFSLAGEVLFPVVGKPVSFEKLIGVPSSLLFQSLHKYDVLRLQLAAKRGIDLCARDKKIFHIAMHDYLENDNLLQAFSAISHYVGKLRDLGNIDIVSMHSLSNLISFVE